MTHLDPSNSLACGVRSDVYPGLEAIQLSEEYAQSTSEDLLVDYGLVTPNEALAAAAEVASRQAAEAFELFTAQKMGDDTFTAIIAASDVARKAERDDAKAKAEILLDVLAADVERDLDTIQQAEPTVSRRHARLWLLRDAYDELFPEGLNEPLSYAIGQLPRLLAVLHGAPLTNNDRAATLNALEEALSLLLPDDTMESVPSSYAAPYPTEGLHDLTRLRTWLDNPEPYAREVVVLET